MQFNVGLQRIHLTPADKARLAQFQADRDADYAEEHSDDSAAESTDYDGAVDYAASDDDYDPLAQSFHKHSLDGWYTWYLFVQLTPVCFLCCAPARILVAEPLRPARTWHEHSETGDQVQ